MRNYYPEYTSISKFTKLNSPPTLTNMFNLLYSKILRITELSGQWSDLQIWVNLAFIFLKPSHPIVYLVLSILPLYYHLNLSSLFSPFPPVQAFICFLDYWNFLTIDLSPISFSSATKEIFLLCLFGHIILLYENLHWFSVIWTLLIHCFEMKSHLPLETFLDLSRD